VSAAKLEEVRSPNAQQWPRTRTKDTLGLFTRNQDEAARDALYPLGWEAYEAEIMRQAARYLTERDSAAGRPATLSHIQARLMASALILRLGAYLSPDCPVCHVYSVEILYSPLSPGGLFAWNARERQPFGKCPEGIC